MAKDEECERRGGAAVFAFGARPKCDFFTGAGRLAQALLVGLAFTGGTYGFVRLAGGHDASVGADAAVVRRGPVWPPPGSDELSASVTPAEGLLGSIPGVYYAPAAVSGGGGDGAEGEKSSTGEAAAAKGTAPLEGETGAGSSQAAADGGGSRQGAMGGASATSSRGRAKPTLQVMAGFQSGGSLNAGSGGGGAGIPGSDMGGAVGGNGNGGGANQGMSSALPGGAGEALSAARAMTAVGGSASRTTGGQGAGNSASRQSRAASAFGARGRNGALIDGGARDAVGAAGGGGFAAAGADSALGQLRAADGLSRSAARQSGEGASGAAGLPFDGGMTGRGGVAGPGTSGGGGLSGGPGEPTRSGSPIVGEGASAPADEPERIVGRNVTPYQKWVQLAQMLLLASSIVLFVAYLLSRTVFGASWAVPLARVAAVLAAGAAAAGVAIMSRGQYLQGAIYTFSGAALAYLSWTAPLGDPRAANGGEAAAAAAAPPSEQASAQLAASQLDGNKTWFATKSASQMPATADSLLKR